jgi:hypothetical protein
VLRPDRHFGNEFWNIDGERFFFGFPKKESACLQKVIHSKDMI